MSDLREAAQMALEALEKQDAISGYPNYKKQRKALRESLAQPPEPYTDDVTRIMRDAGMTFHLGLPHKAVIEQMTRVIDLVCAEASIKAAQKFAAPPQRQPLRTVTYVCPVCAASLERQE